MRVRIVTCVAVTLAAVAAGGSTASAADVLKVAVGQCGNWDSSPVQLGDGAGIYAKHGIAIEAVCTQGTGETQQAVISGSADIGIGIGTLGALGAFSRCADPHHLGQRDRQHRLRSSRRTHAQDH
jgi:NitT/TauT family transport system substrate-binding protein